MRFRMKIRGSTAAQITAIMQWGVSDFDGNVRHFLSLRLVFARFDTRQIGPRLPAPAGATAAPARQARPNLPAIGVRRIPCLPPCGVQQSGRAFPHRGTADPTLGPLSPSQSRQTPQCMIAVICAAVLPRIFIRNLIVHPAGKFLLVQPLAFGGGER